MKLDNAQGIVITVEKYNEWCTQEATFYEARGLFKRDIAQLQDTYDSLHAEADRIYNSYTTALERVDSLSEELKNLK